MCGKPAQRKVEENIFHDDPQPVRLPLTAYVCLPHFEQIMDRGGYTRADFTYNPETHILVERAKVPEDVGAAVDILVGHNKWRRGDAHEPSCTSFELGKVIEKVCQAAALVAKAKGG